jgi:hypothetical protein
LVERIRMSFFQKSILTHKKVCVLEKKFVRELFSTNESVGVRETHDIHERSSLTAPDVVHWTTQ